MNKFNMIITGLIIIGLSTAVLVKVGISADKNLSVNQETSFQNHRDGTYGPVGAGGYGLPDGIKLKDDKEKNDKPLIQDIREGTSFQGHSEGKYGPVGAGGYGIPEFEKQNK